MSEGLLDVLGRGRWREWAAEGLMRRGRRGRRRRHDAAREPERALGAGAVGRRRLRRHRPDPAPTQRPHGRRPRALPPSSPSSPTPS